MPDQSIGRDPGTGEYFDARLRMGTVQSLLSSSAEENGKILNALNFPMPEKGMGDFPFSTDTVAWKRTKGNMNCPPDQGPPLEDLRWGLAANAGALSWWHIDSNGFATYVDTRAGDKVFVFARRKGGGRNFESRSEIDFFLNGMEVDEPNVDRCDLEAVTLPPRTRL